MSERPTVLLLGKLPPPYMGPAIATKLLLESRLKDRFRLLHLDTRLNASLDTMGRWSAGKLWRNVRLNARLFTICRREKPELVLIPISQSTTGFLKDFVFVLLCRLTGRRILLQLRGSNFQSWLSEAPGFMKGVVRLAMNWSEGIIVLGHKLKYLFSDYFPGERIFVIPNGADFVFPQRQRHDIPVFLFFSNLFTPKGITDVLDAVEILKERNAGPFRLDVAGSWLEEDAKNYCEGLVAEFDLPVTFYPALSGSEKLERFAAADVFVFPPRDPEGHPWVIVEALAAGLPILATDKGAITESVKDGDNGYIVKEKDPVALAGRMEQLITDPVSRKRMGERSEAIYRERFTEEKMVEKYVKCFEEVMLPSSG